MPEKYHIETKPVPPRLARIGKYGVVDWREDCARCHNCVKKACVYDRHRQETDYIRHLTDVDSLFFDCMGCFSCVQNCTKGLLGLVVNPVFEGLGNSYWTPEIIQTTWMQAETAKIPVSGAGYRGPFSGPGFDAMWTDMSEIVRPTRDGIHGREYISTSVDIGRKPPFLAFEHERLSGEHPPLVSIPMPLLIDMRPPQFTLPPISEIFGETAARTGLIAIVDPRDWPFEKNDRERLLPRLAFHLDPEAPSVPQDVLNQTRLVELPDGPDILEQIPKIKSASPEIVVSVKVALDSNGCKRAIALTDMEEIEVMGAMGMREVRRLRGDVGRAMFFEQLEEETFGSWRGRPALEINGDVPTRQPGGSFNLEEILPEKTFRTRIPQVQVTREIKTAPSRYRNSIAKYIIRRSSDCIRCGKCVELCPYGVHVDKPGYKYFAEPRLDLCIGPACEKTDHYCVAQCPQSALRMVENPMMKALGDYRWPADMILATWKMAETGEPPAPEYGYEYHCGNSGGGFDKLRFKFPDKPPVEIDENEIDISIELNRRNDGRPRIKIDVPWYGGGMSFGSVSNVTQLSKARGAVAWNTFTCTGEGGYMERLRPYDDRVVTQVATGLFGVREETIQRVPIVEFKYAQGAKPGLGGHLLGDKNTVSVSKMREAALGISLFSPFPFHSVYSIEDHMKRLDWIKHINRRALVSTKVSTPTDVGTGELIALGCVRCTRCESGRGCPRGIATTDSELATQMDIEWGTQRIINLYNAWRKELVQILRRLGMRSVSELRGRTDLLMHLDYNDDVEHKT